MKVLVTGCFDILTAAHVSLLKYAYSYGEVTVGLNSDLAIKALKGSSRPINTYIDRAKVIGVIRYVSDVFEIDDTCVATALLYTRPKIWVKGGDYNLETLNPLEVDAANKVGTKIAFAPKIEGCSTTSIIERIKG